MLTLDPYPTLHDFNRKSRILFLANFVAMSDGARSVLMALLWVADEKLEARAYYADLGEWCFPGITRDSAADKAKKFVDELQALGVLTSSIVEKEVPWGAGTRVLRGSNRFDLSGAEKSLLESPQRKTKPFKHGPAEHGVPFADEYGRLVEDRVVLV